MSLRRISARMGTFRFDIGTTLAIFALCAASRIIYMRHSKMPTRQSLEKPMNANLTDTAQPSIWVVSWIYPDRSGSGLIKAFDSEEKARDLLRILNEYTDTSRRYCLDHLEIEREYT